MRLTAPSVLSTIVTGLVLAACGDGGSGDGDGDGPDAGVDASAPPAEGFRIQTPPFNVPVGVGAEVTKCYYTTIPTTRAMGIKRWSSTMTRGSHHLMVVSL